MSVAVLAGVLLAGLVAVPGAPAGAQDMADLPKLGYEITPDRGYPGDEVHSQVNPDDVREHCWSRGNIDPDGPVADSLDSFMTDFLMAWGRGTALATIDFLATVFGDPWFEELYDQVVAKYGWFPPEDNPGGAALDAIVGGPVPEGIGNPDGEFYEEGEFFMNQVWNAVDAVTGLFGFTDLTAALYPELHVTTFVDPVTQEMLGETGTFDPVTGEGTMLVPELDPGLYAVAAACAFLVPQDQYMEAMTAGFYAAWDWSVENDFFPRAATWQEWAQAGGLGAFFGEMMEPRAIGIDFYCILQPDGFCATPPGPVGLITDGVLEEFNGDGPGDDPLTPGPADDGPGDAGDLVAVDAAPSFTG